MCTAKYQGVLLLPLIQFFRLLDEKMMCSEYFRKLFGGTMLTLVIKYLELQWLFAL